MKNLINTKITALYGRLSQKDGQEGDSISVIKKILEDYACGDGLLAIEESLILSWVAGFFRKYVPVFLAGKNVYKTQNFKRGAKNSLQPTLCAGIV